MGVINVTPDSFSDGGKALDPARALDIALAMEAAGADIIDIGAESTRPGATPVGAAEELARVRPVLQALAPRRQRADFDRHLQGRSRGRWPWTRAPSIVNDISGLRLRPASWVRWSPREGAPVVLMHTRGRPADMYAHADYGDVVGEVIADLQRAVSARRGLRRRARASDCRPGPGLREARRRRAWPRWPASSRLAELGLPDPGRARRASRSWRPPPARWRPRSATGPTAAAVTAAVLGGAHIVRVHDVAKWFTWSASPTRFAPRLATTASGRPDSRG